MTRGPVDPPQLQGGTTCYIQVLNSFVRNMTDSSGIQWRKSGLVKLDSSVPYPYSDATILKDSPGNYTINLIYTDAHDLFSTYLMYVPAGYGLSGNDSVLVPLQRID